MTTDSKPDPDVPRSSLGGIWGWSGPVLGGIALVVAVGGLVSARWTAQEMAERVGRLEGRLGALAEAKGAGPPATFEGLRRLGSRRRPEGKGPRRSSKAPAKAWPNPEGRQQRVRDGVTGRVEGFASEHGLDDAMVGKVLGELEARNDSVRAVFRDLAAGTISAEEAREEVQWVRDGSADTLRVLLGDEIYDALDARLAGRSSLRRRAALTESPREVSTVE